LQSFIQLRSKAEIRGEVLAASSFINWIGILIASGMTFLFNGYLGLSAGDGFSILGVMTLLITISSYLYLPDFLLQSAAWCKGKCL